MCDRTLRRRCENHDRRLNSSSWRSQAPNPRSTSAKPAAHVGSVAAICGESQSMLVQSTMRTVAGQRKPTSTKHAKNTIGSAMKNVLDRLSFGVNMRAGRSTSRARNVKCSTLSTCLSSVRCKPFPHSFEQSQPRGFGVATRQAWRAHLEHCFADSLIVVLKSILFLADREQLWHHCVVRCISNLRQLQRRLVLPPDAAVEHLPRPDTSGAPTIRGHRGRHMEQLIGIVA